MAKIVSKWTRLASSARLQRSSHSLSVLDSRAWIFGGELNPREPVDNQFDVVPLNVEREPVLATTLSVPAGLAPTPRVGSATAVIENSVYMFSGRGGLAMMPIEEHGALWRYSPNEPVWELVKPADPTAPYPQGRSYHAMASDGKKHIYIHAGCPEKGRLSDLWSFDVQSKIWTELRAAPPPARGGASITVHKNKLYRMNGFDGESEQGGALDVYDTGSHTWSTLSFPPDGVQGPVPRSVSTLLSVTLKGEDYILTLFGERDPSSLGHAGAGKMLGDVWAWDIKRGTWSQVESAGESPAPRGWFDADVLDGQDGKKSVIIHGGLAEDNSRLGDAWKLEFVYQ